MRLGCSRLGRCKWFFPNKTYDTFVFNELVCTFELHDACQLTELASIMRAQMHSKSLKTKMCTVLAFKMDAKRFYLASKTYWTSRLSSHEEIFPSQRGMLDKQAELDIIEKRGEYYELWRSIRLTWMLYLGFVCVCLSVKQLHLLYVEWIPWPYEVVILIQMKDNLILPKAVQKSKFGGSLEQHEHFSGFVWLYT